MNPSAVADDAGPRNSQRVLDFPPRKPSHEAGALRLVVQDAGDDAADREAFRAGLLSAPAISSPKFFYDPQGASLFTAICSLDEYYPTRTEASIFETHRGEIAAALPVGSQWVDLGCGDGAKARRWLGPAQVGRYIGVDIAEPWLRSALETLVATLSKERSTASPRGSNALNRPLEVLGIVADFTKPFDLHSILAERPDMPPVFFYPGSSIGNFVRDDAVAFLRSVREHIGRHPSGDAGRLLIGIDLVKDRATLRAAYDDAIGVTAAFNRNVLRVANRLLDADFDPAAFDHRASFDETFGRIEMQLVSRRRQTVRIGEAARTFDADEVIVTEYSHKYTVDGFADLLASAGFASGDGLRCWRDRQDWFGVFVAEPA